MTNRSLGETFCLMLKLVFIVTQVEDSALLDK